MKKISIVVPCYNEQETIMIFYHTIQKYLIKDYAFTLLFIDDGSTDDTYKILSKLSQTDDHVKYLRFSRNFGKESAMLAGLEYSYKADFDATIIMDVDLQDPPELIIDMLNYYEQGYKHIYAKHRSRKDEPKIRTFFAMQFYKVYAYITKDKHIVRGARDFSLLDRDVVKAFIDVNDYTRFTKGIFSWVGFEKKCIEFDYVKRSAGKTKWSFVQLFKYAMRGINQFSHFYKFVPNFVILFISIVIISDFFTLDLTNIVELKILIMEFIMLLLVFVLKAQLNLTYDIRDHGLKRPKYIIEETNMGIENEKYDK